MPAQIELDSNVPLYSRSISGLTWKTARTKPEPITKRAVLESEGYADRKVFTVHVYEETRRMGNGYAHMFRCTKTGHVRRWGFEAFNGDLT